MTTVHRDDVTGEEYQSDSVLAQFRLVIDGATYAQVDAHKDLLYREEGVEQIAAELHTVIDDWEQDRKDHFADD